MNLKKWQIASQETLDELLKETPNKESASLVASLITIIESNLNENTEDDISYQNEEKPVVTVVNDKIDIYPKKGVSEEIEELNEATIKFYESSDKFEMKRTQMAKDEMISSLETMLKEFEDVVQEIRIKCQFQECLSLFKEFYKNLGNKI